MAGHDTQSKAELLTRLTDRMRESLLPVDQPFDDANLDTAAELVLDTASSRTQGEPAVAMADGGEGKRKLRIAIVNDEPRTSLITVPSNGRIPGLTPEAQARRAERRESRSQFAQYDHPEMRPLAERCLTSYGSPAGPPMLPNGGYNSNYIIVQTPDYVMIMTEMVHDTRIIRMGDGPRLPAHIRPWMGDSWGHWEGDVLVVETTNIHPLQPYSSADMKVTERFSRMHEEAILYEFTVDDPSTYTESWGGQIPMMAMHDQIYEYACQEGNYSLEGVLSGARFQETLEAQALNDSGRD